MSRTFTAVSLFFSCLLLPVSVLAVDAGPGELVRTSTVAETRVFNGLVEAVQRSTVSAQTTGRITEINFDVQDYVEKGQVLMRLSDKEQKSRLDSARSSMKEASANAEQAEKEFNRIKSIYEKKLVAKSALDKAIAENKAAEARLKALRAKVAEAQEQWEHTIVRAPYSGIVVERHVQMGETARSGQALMTGLSLDHLRVVVELPQDVSLKARADKRMFVIWPAGQRISIEPANVTIFPYANVQTHSFSTRIKLPPGLPGLYPGMMIKAGVEVGQTTQLLVPAAAVVQRSEVAAVYVQDAEGKVLFRQVRTGHRHGEHIIIMAGLREGEKVLLDPLKAVAALKAQRAR
jgi:RND family efflux transporter MFP subunit